MNWKTVSVAIICRFRGLAVGLSASAVGWLAGIHG